MHAHEIIDNLRELGLDSYSTASRTTARGGNEVRNVGKGDIFL